MENTLFRQAIKRIWQKKLFSFCLSASVAISLFVAFVLSTFIAKELSYDTYWPGAERIHRLIVQQNGITGKVDGRFSNIPRETYRLVQEQFPNELDKISRARHLLVVPSDKLGSQADATSLGRLTLVDPEFQEIFNFEVVAGSMEQVFSQPEYIAVEEKYAESLQIGSTTLDEQISFATLSRNPRSASFHIGAIFRLPPNVSPPVDYKLIALMSERAKGMLEPNVRESDGWGDQSEVWVKLKGDSSSANINAMLPEFVKNVLSSYERSLDETTKNNIDQHLNYYLQPITKIHFNPVEFEKPLISNIANLTIVTVIGASVLLLGLSNAVNVNLASTIYRRKEIGIRKALGAGRSDIIREFFQEIIFLAIISLMFAVPLIEWSRPFLQNFFGFALGDEPWSISAAKLLGLTLCVVLSCTAYPALILSKVRPETVLRPGSSRHVVQESKIRGRIVFVQFLLAAALLSETAFLYGQLRLLNSQPLGFNGENLLIVDSNSAQELYKAEAAKNELLNIPGISGVVHNVSRPNPTGLLNPASAVSFQSLDNLDRAIRAERNFVDSGFFALVGIPLLAGRDHDLYDSDTLQEVGSASRIEQLVVNRELTRVLGFATPGDAVGQVIKQKFFNQSLRREVEIEYEIIGVVENNRYHDLVRAPGPVVYPRIRNAGAGSFLLGFDLNARESVVNEIYRVWRDVHDLSPAGVTFVDSIIDEAFLEVRKISSLTMTLGGFSLLLASIGLYGMTAIAVSRNVKEMAIRKTYGASARAVGCLILMRSLKPVLLAIVAACPIAIFAGLIIVRKYSTQLDREWWVPISLVTSVAVLMIAAITIGVIVKQAAMEKPITALRSE